MQEHHTEATLWQFIRMCTAHSEDCEPCPLYQRDLCDGYLPQGDRATINKLIIEWNEAHPPMTRLAHLLSAFPNCNTDAHYVPVICPVEVDKNFRCQNIECTDCRRAYWLAEIENQI